MAASSVLGYLGQARLEDVPFWSVVYALVTIYCGHCMPSSLLFRATETDALIVCINGVVLAMNLMLLPLTLQVASSSTSIFLVVFSRWDEGCVGVLGQYGEAVGCDEWGVSADAGGAF